MSRWRDDPEAAARQLIGRALADIDVRGRVLLAYAAPAEVAAALAARGAACDHWLRRAGPGSPPAAVRRWPPQGPFDCVLLRLPAARDELEMATHACLGVLAPTGSLIVYGGNDEGIRSAAGVIGKCSGPVATLAARGHGRVLAARAPRDRSALRGALADWRQETQLQIGGRTRSWISYPGMFAAGRIDAATGLLIANLPSLARGARLLDFGCGSGVIGASALYENAAHAGALALDLLDNDAVALAAAGENVPEGRTLLAAALAGAPRGYDAILSNPPLHRGIARDLGLLADLIGEAPRHLAPGGALIIVVQRAIDAGRLMQAHLAGVANLAQNAGFRLWRGVRAKGGEVEGR
jgi:16S rRNA (guanine1207-N2)-methyltransferase